MTITGFHYNENFDAKRAMILDYVRKRKNEIIAIKVGHYVVIGGATYIVTTGLLDLLGKVGDLVTTFFVGFEVPIGELGKIAIGLGVMGGSLLDIKYKNDEKAALHDIYNETVRGETFPTVNTIEDVKELVGQMQAAKRLARTVETRKRYI